MNCVNQKLLKRRRCTFHRLCWPVTSVLWCRNLACELATAPPSFLIPQLISLHFSSVQFSRKANSFVSSCLFQVVETENAFINVAPQPDHRLHEMSLCDFSALHNVSYFHELEFSTGSYKGILPHFPQIALQKKKQLEVQSSCWPVTVRTIRPCDNLFIC